MACCVTDDPDYWDSARNDWALCELCGTPEILHYSSGSGDASLLCVIVRYLPKGHDLQRLPSPMPALIAAFERQVIHGSFRLTDEAEHAAWAASAMDCYDIVSELNWRIWRKRMESREIGESAELSGESSSPGGLAASAVSVVAQAASEKILQFGMFNGYLIISDYPSRVGILRTPFASEAVARKFWQTSVAATLVECPCGWGMKIFNFSLDAIHCPQCSGDVSSPAGNKIEISGRVLDAVKCKCGETCVWLNEADAKKYLRTTLDPNEHQRVELEPTPLPIEILPRKNKWGELISPYCVSPGCLVYFGSEGKRLDTRLVESQLKIGVRDAFQRVCEHGGAIEALLASDPTG